MSRPPLERPRRAKCSGDRVVVGDEVLGGGEEVVKDVLLVLEHRRFVPRLAILIAAAQVGEREEPALLHPPRVFGVPLGQHGDIEAAIAGHQEPCLAVALQAFLAGDEHGDARAVFRGVEDLGDFILRGVERNLGRGEDFRFSASGVIAKNGGRLMNDSKV